MSTVNTPQIESVLRRQVLDILDLAKAGQFSKSLGTVKSAKSFYPKNIFVIALEKQIEKLLAMTYSPALTDPERQKELLESIPNLVHRAVEAMDKEEPVPASRPSEHLEEREAAFARLKDEYFQLADSYVKNGEYQNALQEIKRVLILDPENSTAKEYQKKINEFVDLKAKSSPEQQPPVQQEKKSKPEPEPPQPARERNSSDARQLQREKEVEKAAPKHPAEPVVSTRQKKRSINTVILVAVPAFVACLAAAYFFFAPQDTNSQPVAASTVSNTSAAPTQGASEPPKVEPQPEKQESQEAVSPASVDNQQPASSQNQSAGATTKIETGSENPSSSVGTASPVSQVMKTTTETKSPVEPPPAVVEKSQGTRSRSSAATSYDKIGSRGLETSETKPPQLAKLDIAPPLPASSSAKASPAPITYTERRPQIVHLVTPKFPEAARQTGAQGEVLVSVQIDPQGKPIRAKILRTSSELFNATVIDAVMHSQYSPGVMPSGPVTTWLTVPFTFKRSADN